MAVSVAAWPAGARSNWLRSVWPYLPIAIVLLVFGLLFAYLVHGLAAPIQSPALQTLISALIGAASEVVEVTGARHDLGSKTLDVPAFAVDAALRLLG